MRACSAYLTFYIPMNFHNHKDCKIAEVFPNDVSIKTTQDALDLMADADYNGARKIIIHKDCLPEDFFNLRTQLAGDILQKFSNYQIGVSIVGDFSGYQSTSLKAFIIESNRGNLVSFVPDAETALEKLVG